jgi:hypothetical protein
MGNLHFRGLAGILIGACGVAGYAVGNARNGVGKTDAEPVVVTHKAERPMTRERRTEEDALVNFSGLLAANSRETDIWKVVSRLPAEKIPEALRRLREARAKFPEDGLDARRLGEIEAAVYFHWAEMDPQAALADVVAMPVPRKLADQLRHSLLMKTVLTAWMRTDANAAYRAVKHDEKLEYYGRDLLVRLWTPENVFDNLNRYPEGHQLLLGWYCGKAAEDPEERSAMLAALKERPDLKNRDRGYQLLFRSWGYKDFNAAIAEAEAQKMPGIMKQLVQDNIEMSPQTVFPWATQRGVPIGGPLWEKGYYEWLGFGGPEARQWLAKQAPVWESQGNSASAAGFLAEDFTNAQAMKFTAEQESAGRRLTELMERWKAKDPAAAEKWLDTAPPAARELLTGMGAGDHE